ncbi:MAG: amidohydrolase [Phenylobacterium sp.]|nr:amidohydrolase [Phenylobacterium sp.]
MARARKGGVDRRRLFTLTGAGVAASALPLAEARGQAPGSAPLVTITEGTNIAVVPSPDGRTLAFDLFGVVWTIPVTGGAARRLTDDFADAAQPDWTPDGRRLVFQSYRDGAFQIWSVGADGSGLAQHTRGPFDCREPRVSPDGRKVAFSSDRGGDYAIYLLDRASGRIDLFAKSSGQACEPAWSPDGQRLAFAVDRERIEVVDLAGVRTPGPKVTASADRFNPTELHSPAFTPDGRGLVYWVLENGDVQLRAAAGPLVTGEDVFPFRAVWLKGGDLLYTADGKIRRRTAAGVREIPFSVAVPVQRATYRKKPRDFASPGPRPVVGVGSPALSPDGRHAVFRALNGLWLTELGAKPKLLVRDGYWVCDPAWSPDGRTLAYSTDRRGKLDIWLRDMASGAERQLTHHKDAALSSAWSKDGRQIAFLDQNGSLHTVDVGSGAVRQVFGAIWEPGKPSWSLDGKTIALAAFKPYSARFREGLSEILTVDVASGQATYQPIFPQKSLGTRGDDGPVWSPDGTRMAMVFASRLWTVPVEASGRFAGEPKALNEEVTDAPTWSGDSSKLLYLSNGEFRLVDAAGGPPRRLPVNLTWAAARPAGRLVIKAGRLWDGQSPQLRRDVDVIVEGDRIAAVVPAGGPMPGDAKVIEAKDATVMPGLVEMHAHRQMQGYGYGDREGRLWLSLGVTTTRSPGSPAYHMVEDREAIDSGARTGPRYFATGEAIDGSRIFYNFMRPVTEPGQLDLELSRAEALSYDLIKTYVRLPLQDQKLVAAWAHDRGLHVTSHYADPALAFGLDGMEHIGATSRTGYSRSVSATGASYQDIAALFIASGARRTPTLFQASALYATDRSLVDDPRIKALYPPWEHAKLTQRADQAARSDMSAALAALERNVAHLKVILQGGGRVVTGTDSPIDFNAVSLHMNLRGMVRYGLTPYEALTTATRFPGEYLQQPIGVVAPGMLADLVVVDGDPLTRIEDAAAVRLTIKGGEVFDIPTLTAPFANVVAQAAQPVQRVFAAAPSHWWHGEDYVEESRSACCVDGRCRSWPKFGARV